VDIITISTNVASSGHNIAEELLIWRLATNKQKQNIPLDHLKWEETNLKMFVYLQ
jgi:hypothetical protein